MNDRLLVSIIINNYNYSQFLSQAIDSALNQTYPHIEVIVVDDGSTDESPEIIKSYRERIIPIFKENGNHASTLNAGFLVSRGDIICFLDSDDIFVNDKVEEVVKVFNLYQDIGWCFHPLKLVDSYTGAVIGINCAFPQLKEDKSSLCDYRLQIKRGNLPFYAPSTSGLCFTKLSLKQIFPMPEVLEQACDRYLTNVVLSLYQGFFLNKPLTIQGIHGNNEVTLREGIKHEQKNARNAIVVAYFMRLNFPGLAMFSNRVFARGLSTSFRYGGLERDGNEFINKYLSNISLFEKIGIFIIAIYQNRPWKKVTLYRTPEAE